MSDIRAKCERLLKLEWSIENEPLVGDYSGRKGMFERFAYANGPIIARYLLRLLDEKAAAEKTQSHEMLEEAVRSTLGAIPNIEAVFLDSSQIFFVVVREHETVNWEQLIEAEDFLNAQFGIGMQFCVRAHQGRGVDMWEGRLRRIL